MAKACPELLMLLTGLDTIRVCIVMDGNYVGIESKM